MNSFISHFRWVAILLGLIALTEVAVGVLWPRPAAMRNGFLAYPFAQSDTVQRAFVAEKVLQFDDAKPDMIQVGDSSGFHAIQSPIVESYLNGRSFLNLSVASNLGYGGFEAIARRMMERSGTVKVLVVYFTPGGAAPRHILTDARDLMAADIEREYASAFHRLFQVPSLGVRREVTDAVHHLGFMMRSGRPPTSNPQFPMIRDILKASNGWARETDIPDDHIDGLFKMLREHTPHLRGLTDAEVVYSFYISIGVAGVDKRWDWRTLSRRTYIDITLDRFRALTRAHGARLVVAMNPMPASFRTKEFQLAFDIDGISAALRDYEKRHPEVSILDVDYWLDEKFSVFSHVGTPYSAESSHRMGRFLSGLKDLPPPANPSTTRYRAPEHVTLDMSASPMLYGFSDLQRQGARGFRSIRSGRFEGLAYARVQPGTSHELRITAPDDGDQPASKALAVGVFGTRLERLPDAVGSGARHHRFTLPAEIAGRFDGWIELLISTRGAVTWQDNALHADATGPQLRIERIDIVPAP